MPRRVTRKPQISIAKLVNISGLALIRQNAHLAHLDSHTRSSTTDGSKTTSGFGSRNRFRADIAAAGARHVSVAVSVAGAFLDVYSTAAKSLV